MSTDYNIHCFTCRESGPIVASGSISYGFRVWKNGKFEEWLGNGEACGNHEGHDIRIVSEHEALPWVNEEGES